MARAFIGTWVARFGTPSDLSSDRGSQFTSELWNAVAEGLGVKLHRTTAYHPQANGLCERFHRSMKAALRASLKDGDWVDRLPWVMLGLRCAPKEDLQSSSAELVYGQALRVPGYFIPDASVPWSAARQRSSLLETAKVFAPVPTSQQGTPLSACPPICARCATPAYCRDSLDLVDPRDLQVGARHQRARCFLRLNPCHPHMPGSGRCPFPSQGL